MPVFSKDLGFPSLSTVSIMSRMPTFRLNYDDFRRLSLSDLTRKDLATKLFNTRLSQVFDTRVTDNIKVSVRFNEPGPKVGYLEMTYRYKGNEVSTKIDLVQLPSNLGKPGGIWYFICPVTQKRCRILYSTGICLASRHAFRNTLYESQTHSKAYRLIVSLYAPSIKLDEAWSALYQRYGKRHYRGKPTPKAKKVLKLEQLDDRAAEILNRQSLQRKE